MTTDLATTTQDASRFDDKFDRIVKYWRCRLDDNDPNKVKLPAALERQLEAWISIHAMLSTGRYPKTSQQLSMIQKEFPTISARTARNYLEDTKRFFASTNPTNLAYEREMIIEELRETLRQAKTSDLRSYAALMKIYVDVIGANKAEQVVDNKTVINIINYNPEQLGGQVISDADLQKMVDKMTAIDKKKQAELFDDYEDVTGTKNPA